jgi:hypothetical protein
MRNLHEEHQEKPTFEDELKTYSDDGLWNLDNRLSIEMQGTPMGSPLYDELTYQYNTLVDEMQRRKLIKMPF